MHVIFNMEAHMGKALDVRPRKSTNVTLPPEVLESMNVNIQPFLRKYPNFPVLVQIYLEYIH